MMSESKVSNNTSEQLDYHIAFFKALAHPTRLKIVHLLEAGELCVCDIEKEIDSDLSTISRHLTQLKSAYVVADRREGKRVYYRLQAECVLPFLNCINANHPNAKTGCR